MSSGHTHMPLDAQGIPILTELVDEATDGALEALASKQDPREVVRELMESPALQQTIGTIADSIAQDVHLQLEQVLTTAIDDAINKALAGSDTRMRDLINRKLETSIPEIIRQALQDA